MPFYMVYVTFVYGMKSSVKSCGTSLLCLLLLSFLLSCEHKKERGADNGTAVVRFQYATLIRIVRGSHYDMAEIRNPWDSTKLLHRYILLSHTDSLPQDLPSGTVLRIPLRRVVLGSSVHSALCRDLHAEEQVCGLCDVGYIMSDYWKKVLRSGRVKDMGSAMNINGERILSSSCDAVFLSPYENGTYGAVEKTGVPIVECADYMEVSPLARAEWMRFYGILFGKAAEADSLFFAVRDRYLGIKAEAMVSSIKPEVFMDMPYSAVWYQPGGESTIGRLIQDAGGRNAFARYRQRGSVPLSFEKVLYTARNARIWLIRYSNPQELTYASLRAENEGFSLFRAWKDRRVWGCNLQKKAFYEETPFRPDVLLEELSRIFRSDGKDTVGTRYFNPLL